MKISRERFLRIVTGYKRFQNFKQVDLQGKNTSEKARHRWEDNIRMNLKDVGVIKSNWIVSAQDRNSCRAVANEALSQVYN